MPTTDRLAYSPEEFAAATSMSIRHVYRMLQAGRIPHRRFGRRIVIGRAAAEDFLRGTPNESAAPVETR